MSHIPLLQEVNVFEKIHYQPQTPVGILNLTNRRGFYNLIHQIEPTDEKRFDVYGGDYHFCIGDWEDPYYAFLETKYQYRISGAGRAVIRNSGVDEKDYFWLQTAFQERHWQNMYLFFINNTNSLKEWIHYGHSCTAIIDPNTSHFVQSVMGGVSSISLGGSGDYLNPAAAEVFSNQRIFQAHQTASVIKDGLDLIEHKANSSAFQNYIQMIKEALPAEEAHKVDKIIQEDEMSRHKLAVNLSKLGCSPTTIDIVDEIISTQRNPYMIQLGFVEQINLVARALKGLLDLKFKEI